MKYSILLVLLLTSCAKVGHFRPVSLAPAEKTVVSEAFEAWCTASKGTKCAVLDNRGGADILLVNDLPDTIWGMYDAAHSKIVVRNARGMTGWLDVLRAVMLHETGHHFFCVEEAKTFTGPSVMGYVPQSLAMHGIVDLEALRQRKVCPAW